MIYSSHKKKKKENIFDILNAFIVNFLYYIYNFFEKFGNSILYFLRVPEKSLFIQKYYFLFDKRFSVAEIHISNYIFVFTSAGIFGFINKTVYYLLKTKFL